MRATAHGDQAHLAPEFGLDQGPHNDIRALRDRISRHERETEAGRDHGEDPVVSLTAIDALDFGTLSGKHIAGDVRLLAVVRFK